jgi:enamine deaminase RidA (YjgF/YER057c/UK114 family)
VSIGIELVRPAGLAATAPYAYAAATEPGRMTFTAGDIAGQARQVMANLATALEGAGVGLGDVLKSTIYVATTDRDDLVAAWDVVREAMNGHDAPSTLVGVTVLGYPDQLVEVEAIAIRDSWPEPAPPHDGDGDGDSEDS